MTFAFRHDSRNDLRCLVVCLSRWNGDYTILSLRIHHRKIKAIGVYEATVGGEHDLLLVGLMSYSSVAFSFGDE